MRAILVIAAIAGTSIGGLTLTLVGSDLLNNVKGLLPGDRKFYDLMLGNFLPWNKFLFWRDTIREHRRLFPESRLVPIYLASVILMFSSMLVLFIGIFILK